jgi:hypothetical protein
MPDRRGEEMKAFQRERGGHSGGASWFARAIGVGLSAGLALSSVGCAARYSTENLHAIAPNAGIVDVCVRFPMADPDATVVAYDSKTRTAVSDGDWAKFEAFAAKEADFIYRFDPNMPDETASMLPEPYDKMTCQTLSATQTPPLPKGMQPIAITPAMREALVSALIERYSEQLRPSTQEKAFIPSIGDRRYLAQSLFLGPAVDGRTPQEKIEAVGQMLRDAIRFAAPKIPGPTDEQISIIDTKGGQIIGGFAAGGTIGLVPGGAFISEKLQADPNLPKPTREFLLAHGGGELLSGGVQVILGTGGSVGGGALSMTGGGALLGVPICTAGVTLAANGTITFLHGLKTVTVAICDWHQLPSIEDAQPLAAVAPKDAAGPPAPPPANPAPAPAPAKPAPAPVQAAPVKPVVAPIKPAPVNAVKPVNKPPKSTEPIVVRTRPSGTTTTTRPRLKDGQEPCDTTLTVRTDAEGQVVSMEVTTTEKAVSAELKPYGGTGGGHHPVAKRAMEGAPNYDANKALAIPNNELKRLNVKHPEITGAQRKRYTNFAKTGKPLTWDKVAEIETASLVDALMDPKVAQATVAKAIQALKDSNVPGPMRIPWGLK